MGAETVRKIACNEMEKLKDEPCQRGRGYPCTNATIYGPDWQKHCDCGLAERHAAIDAAILVIKKA